MDETETEAETPTVSKEDQDSDNIIIGSSIEEESKIDSIKKFAPTTYKVVNSEKEKEANKSRYCHRRKNNYSSDDSTEKEKLLGNDE